MGRVVAFTSLTLDGVMQAPGRLDEDRRDGFEHGGWALPYADAVQGRAVGESMATAPALLFWATDVRGLLRRPTQPNRQPLHRGAQQHAEVRGLHDAAGAAPVAQLHPAQRRR